MFEELFVHYDTETTGLFKNHWPLNHPQNPRIVQLAALVTDVNNKPIRQMNVIIKPDGWVVPEVAAKVHGITTERANDEGIPILDAIDQWNELIRGVDHMVAFNNQYDIRLLSIEFDKLKKLTYWKDKKQWCAMQMAKPIVKCPPTDKMLAAGMGHMYKPPKLMEAYKFFFGKEFEGAHNARDDVRALSEVFFHMYNMKPS